MRIDPTQSSRIQSAAERPAAARPKHAQPASRQADSVTLSNSSERLRRAQELAAAAPDVRAEKVAALKEEVQNGTYQVDNQALAEKLLKAL